MRKEFTSEFLKSHFEKIEEKINKVLVQKQNKEKEQTLGKAFIFFLPEKERHPVDFRERTQQWSFIFGDVQSRILLFRKWISQ